MKFLKIKNIEKCSEKDVFDIHHCISEKYFIEEHPNLIVNGLVIENCSRHASGCIIGEDLNKYMPLIRSGDVLQTPWPEGQAIRLLEPMGFIKFDILGLASLRMMRQAIYLILKNRHNIKDPSFEEIKKFYDENIHPNKIDFNDEVVYKHIFHEGRFHNVFQFQEKGIQAFCKLAKPNSLEEISNISAIYRPGTLSIGGDKIYLENKENPNNVEYIHPILKEILNSTYGICVFQEQIAEIVHKLGKNVSLEEGNQLRKLLIKKGDEKGGGKKEKIYKKYIEGCLEKNISIDKAEELWRSLESFNKYGFNKSHSICYSIISFQCAHFLTYYPMEWACAFLEKDNDFEVKKEKSIAAAKQMGLEIEKANVNTSENMWEISKTKPNTIIQPLTSLKGLGDSAIENIVKNRYYEKIEDLLFFKSSIVKLNKKVLEVLIKSQTLNHLMDERFKNLKHFYLSVCEKRPTNQKEFENNIFIHSNVQDFSEEEKIEFKIEYTGIFPLFEIMNLQLMERLEKKCIPPISEYDQNLRICWAIPRSVEIKTTSKGKEYYNVLLIDSNFSMTKMRCWGINSKKDVLYLNRPYMIVPRYDSIWGMSSNGPLYKSWKLLG